MSRSVSQLVTSLLSINALTYMRMATLLPRRLHLDLWLLDRHAELLIAIGTEVDGTRDCLHPFCYRSDFVELGQEDVDLRRNPDGRLSASASVEYCLRSTHIGIWTHGLLDTSTFDRAQDLDDYILNYFDLGSRVTLRGRRHEDRCLESVVAPLSAYLASI